MGSHLTMTAKIQDAVVQKERIDMILPLQDALGEPMQPHLMSVGKGAGVVGDESEWVNVLAVHCNTATARCGYHIDSCAWHPGQLLAAGFQGSGHGRMQSARHFAVAEIVTMVMQALSPS
ncbi:hypothetical protein J3458_001397 [Metarhizium acridum]|uniref:uncharacterized protein n=1 Tax=Metarhizium acridum TaxID=92637 RepID=UPI001C6CFCDE|nr:hypothetical protein J3458_001397 [Metarhizium acridum]